MVRTVCINPGTAWGVTWTHYHCLLRSTWEQPAHKGTTFQFILSFIPELHVHSQVSGQTGFPTVWEYTFSHQSFCGLILRPNQKHYHIGGCLRCIFHSKLFPIPRTICLYVQFITKNSTELYIYNKMMMIYTGLKKLSVFDMHISVLLNFPISDMPDIQLYLLIKL